MQNASEVAVAPKIKARVRPGNKYGTARAGEVVEVTAPELANAKHALVSLDAEAAATAAAQAPVAKVDSAFEAARLSARAGSEAMKVSMGERLRAQNGPLIDAAVNAAIGSLRADMAAMEARITDMLNRAAPRSDNRQGSKG